MTSLPVAHYFAQTHKFTHAPLHRPAGRSGGPAAASTEARSALDLDEATVGAVLASPWVATIISILQDVDSLPEDADPAELAELLLARA